MRKIKWYQYFGIGAYVAGWMSRSIALQPGEEKPVITEAELKELVNGLADLIGEMFELEIKL